MDITQNMEIVYASWYLCDRWDSNEESGCSLHKNMADFESWVKQYREKVSHHGSMPDCYHIARKPKTAYVGNELYQTICASEFGLRIDPEEEELLIKENKIILSKQDKQD